MKESIIITVLVIIIYIFFVSNKTNLLLIENNGNSIYVRDMPDKDDSAIILSELINRMYSLRNYVIERRTNYIDFIEYIDLMNKNFSKTRTSIYENKIDSELTSYSVNKGEEIVFCLRCKTTKRLHNINLLVYVAVHEMAHCACPEIGHPPLFNKIFKFLLEEGVKLQLYYYENYNTNPVSYCGMNLHSNILG